MDGASDGAVSAKAAAQPELAAVAKLNATTRFIFFLASVILQKKQQRH
jgi:hypothetical protein